jgi:DHA1 family inner membrane transport protein
VLGGRVTDRVGIEVAAAGRGGGSHRRAGLVPGSRDHRGGRRVVLFPWGVGTWPFNPPTQHRLLELAPGASGLLLSLNASAIYLGVGLWGGWGADDRRPDDAAALVSVAGLLAVALGWRLRAQPSGASTSQSEPGKINPSCPSANLTK